MPSDPLHLLRLNALELLRRPGLGRSIATELGAPDLGAADERITGPIGIDVEAVSNIDGIVVHGTITTPWQAPCRRCLTDVTGSARTEVDEVYQEHPSDDEACLIDGDQIDLAPVVREYVLLALPDGPLCRDDCAGICPVCGIDRNAASCDCDTTVRDERWSALDDLVLDDDS